MDCFPFFQTFKKRGTNKSTRSLPKAESRPESEPSLEPAPKSPEQTFSLPEKEEKNGSNFLGDEEFAFEETKRRHWYHEESYDQRNQEIPNQSVFDGSNHRATFVIIRKEKINPGDTLSKDISEG